MLPLFFAAVDAYAIAPPRDKTIYRHMPLSRYAASVAPLSPAPLPCRRYAATPMSLPQPHAIYAPSADVAKVADTSDAAAGGVYAAASRYRLCRTNALQDTVTGAYALAAMLRQRFIFAA
jgi:hypothetical protein